MPLPDVLPTTDVLVAFCRLANDRTGRLFVLRLLAQRDWKKDWPRSDNCAMVNANGAGIVSARDWALDYSARRFAKRHDQSDRRQVCGSKADIHWDYLHFAGFDRRYRRRDYRLRSAEEHVIRCPGFVGARSLLLANSQKSFASQQ